MKILGINGHSAHRPRRTSHDSGAALSHKGHLIAAVNEERFSRIKQDSNYPFASIAFVLKHGRPDAVALPWLGPREQKPMLDALFKHLKEMRSFKPIRAFYWRQQHARWARLLRPNRRTLPKSLKGLPVHVIEHHHAHAASAYFCCPWKDSPVLVITLDGQGDFASGSIWIGDGGRLRLIDRWDALNSIGHVYAAFTAYLGLTPLRHEGKVVGLAAYGNPEPLLHRLLEHTHVHDWHRLLSPQLCWIGLRPQSSEAKAQMDAWCQGLKREDIAAGLQAWTEHVVCHLIKEAVKRHRIPYLALAGGVFANVKLNQRIMALSEVENVYIHPHMGDGGLASGAALAATAEIQGRLAPRFLDSVYLGPDVSEEEAAAALKRAGLRFEIPHDLPERVADLLAKGKVVARAAGCMEYGPRALGNRSILAACGDPTINRWLNERLDRTEFMPFAPIIMEEHAAKYFPAWRPEHVAARFMTITYDASELAKRNIPAAIHLDGTARPQVLRRQDNPDVYAILEAYYKRTGIPALINTSFNMHEEPIVCTAYDAIRAFQRGHLDALILGRFLCTGG